MKRWIHVLSLALWLPAPPAAAQSDVAAGESKPPQCAFQRHDDPDYILWICNPEGTAHSLEGSVLWVRRNEAGAEIVTSVWHGPSSDLVTRAEAIITTHRKSNALCARYVYLAQAVDRSVRWNTATRGMVADLKRAARARPSPLCFAPEPGAADFIIVWGERADRLPNAFSVDIPMAAGGPAADPGPRDPRPLLAVGPEPGTLAVAVYRVHPGLDNTLLRLGPSVFAASNDRLPGAKPLRVSPLQQALAFVATSATAPSSP